MVLEPPKSEHVFEALFGDDGFGMVVCALWGMVRLAALFVGVVRGTAHSAELEMLAALRSAATLDGAQE